MNWTDLAPDRYQWQALVNTVINCRFHKIWAIFWLAEDSARYADFEPFAIM